METPGEGENANLSPVKTFSQREILYNDNNAFSLSSPRNSSVCAQSALSCLSNSLSCYPAMRVDVELFTYCLGDFTSRREFRDYLDYCSPSANKETASER